MRISDWSSDVCSSDLRLEKSRSQRRVAVFPEKRWSCLINRDGESKTYIIVATDKLPLRLEPDPQIRAVPELLTHAETAARVAGRRVFVFITAALIAPTPRRHSRRPALAPAARPPTAL